MSEEKDHLIEGSDAEESPFGKFMGFFEHLEELRKRLIRSIIFLGVATLICLFFSERLLSFVTSAFEAGETMHLALLHPTEGFVVRLKVSFVAGLFLSSPFWFAQLWGFLSPGLYSNEKKVIIPAIIASSGAFLTGATFGYYILPYAVAYFQSFATVDTAVSWSLGKYLDFSLRLFIAFGVVFELPLIIYLVARLGLVTPAQLKNHRRHAAVAVLAASGLITPPDIFTMIVLAVPLIILYEIGILMASFAVKRKVKNDTLIETSKIEKGANT